MGLDPVPVVPGRRAHEVDEAGEGVLDVPAEDVAVRDEDRRVDVGGVGSRSRTRRLEVDPLRPDHERDLGQPQTGILVRRVLGDGLLVGLRCRLQVAALDRGVGLLVQRRHRLLGVTVTGRHLDPAGHTLLHREGEELVDDPLEVLRRGQSLEERDRLPLEQAERDRQLRRLDRLGDTGVGRQVDRHDLEPALLALGDVHDSGQDRLGLRRLRGPQHGDGGHRYRALDDLVEARVVADEDDR